MKTSDYEGCPLQKMLGCVGGKWKLLIIYNLKESGVIRFSALSRLMPSISQKVLTAQLKELASDKFVHRKVYAEVPPRVEYSLTKLGLSLYPVLDVMSSWAGNNLAKK
jgi:DNA-binding HxlR family transcriptional regulator